MPRGREGGEPESLEPIDLELELGPPATLTRAQRTRSRFGWTLLGVGIACGVALLVGLSITSHSSTSRSDASNAVTNPGLFFPNLGQHGATTIVMPSGLTVALSGGVRKAIGGLGASFGGQAGSVSFRIARGAPSDFFATLGPRAISVPAPVAAAEAITGDFADYGGQFGVLSTGDWTLVAFLVDDQADARTELAQLGSLRLRSTPHGAVVTASSGAAIGDEFVVFGQAPGATDRQVELTDDNCVPGSGTAPTVSDSQAIAVWCEQGVLVRVEGSQSYVDKVVADFKVKVQPRS